jgi:hypothetical protein
MAVRWSTIVCLTCLCNAVGAHTCSFLYTQFLAVDANFKLKGKDRGINDPDLTPGWASFVEDSRYQEHIIKYVDQAEVRHRRSPFVSHQV